jgi:hypothetical protein
MHKLNLFNTYDIIYIAQIHYKMINYPFKTCVLQTCYKSQVQQTQHFSHIFSQNLSTRFFFKKLMQLQHKQRCTIHAI